MSNTENRVISIEYELKEKGNDEILDSNIGHSPLSFVSGKGHIIPGLEKELMNMSAGEKATISVPSSEAYGEYNPEAIQTLPKEQFAGIDLEIGMPLYGQSEDGQSVQVIVKEFNDNEVVIDYNHPLAGKDLEFSVNILESREATADEVISGQVGGAAEGCNCGTGCGC